MKWARIYWRVWGVVATIIAISAAVRLFQHDLAAE